jgi:hypothetical protein
VVLIASARDMRRLRLFQRRPGRGEAAAEEHGWTLNEAIEDLRDEEGEGEINQQQDAHGNATQKRMDENEENGSVNEVEAVGDLAEVVDRPAGLEAVEGPAVHRKDDEHDCSGGGAPVVQISGNGKALDDAAGIGEPIEHQGDQSDSAPPA